MRKLDVEVAISHALEEYQDKVGVIITGRCRKQRITAARHAFIAAARRSFERSTTTMIGRIVDRDHTTVIHSTKIVASCVGATDDFSKMVMKFFRVALQSLNSQNVEVEDDITGSLDEMIAKNQAARIIIDNQRVEISRLENIILKMEDELSDAETRYSKENFELTEKLRRARQHKIDPEVLRLERLKEEYLG